MNIQCQSCDELVPIGVFRASARGIDVTCAACGDSFFVPADPAADAARPVADNTPGDGEMACPKCETVQIEASACRACGLRRELFGSHETADAAAGSPALEALWELCLDDWTDDARHARFAEAAATEGAYLVAVRRYRGVLRERGGDAVAEAQLERMSKMAEAALMSAAAARATGESSPEPYRNLVILLIVLLLVGGALGMYALITTGTADSDEPPTPTRTHTPGPPLR